MHITRTEVRRLFLLSIFAILLVGCASQMSENDKFLWNGGTNSPSSTVK